MLVTSTPDIVPTAALLVYCFLPNATSSAKHCGNDNGQLDMVDNLFLSHQTVESRFVFNNFLNLF
jgi:hypothetical protein